TGVGSPPWSVRTPAGANAQTAPAAPGFRAGLPPHPRRWSRPAAGKTRPAGQPVQSVRKSSACNDSSGPGDSGPPGGPAKGRHRESASPPPALSPNAQRPPVQTAAEKGIAHSRPSPARPPPGRHTAGKPNPRRRKGQGRLRCAHEKTPSGSYGSSHLPAPLPSGRQDRSPAPFRLRTSAALHPNWTNFTYYMVSQGHVPVKRPLLPDKSCPSCKKPPDAEKQICIRGPEEAKRGPPGV